MENGKKLLIQILTQAFNQRAGRVKLQLGGPVEFLIDNQAQNLQLPQAIDQAGMQEIYGFLFPNDKAALATGQTTKGTLLIPNKGNVLLIAQPAAPASLRLYLPPAGTALFESDWARLNTKTITPAGGFDPGAGVFVPPVPAGMVPAPPVPPTPPAPPAGHGDFVPPGALGGDGGMFGGPPPPMPPPPAPQPADAGGMFGGFTPPAAMEPQDGAAGAPGLPGIGAPTGLPFGAMAAEPPAPQAAEAGDFGAGMFNLGGAGLAPQPVAEPEPPPPMPMPVFEAQATVPPVIQPVSQPVQPVIQPVQPVIQAAAPAAAQATIHPVIQPAAPAIRPAAPAAPELRPRPPAAPAQGGHHHDEDDAPGTIHFGPAGDGMPVTSTGQNPIDAVLTDMVKRKASDAHIVCGEPLALRIDGEIHRVGTKPVDAAMLGTWLLPIMPRRNQKEFADCNDTDFAYEIQGVSRFRVNVFRDRLGVGSVIRTIPSRILTARDLNLPPAIMKFCNLSKGLVLVTGPTGSGKSTTLAAMVDHINKTRHDHIITIEDPVEFVHPQQNCLVNQREVHKHTNSFARALRAALREDPDIVLVGEMRDLETVAIGIETAETGHLVFGTLHTNTAVSTIDRIIDQFPTDRQSQIRMMLASSLKGVVAQTLLKKRGGGRVAAHEILVVSDPVSAMIREGKNHMIANHMQSNKQDGNILLNESLLKVVKDGLVDPEDAMRKAVDKVGLMDAFKRNGVKYGEAEAGAAAGAPAAPAKPGAAPAPAPAAKPKQSA